MSANPATEYLDSFHCNWKYIQNFLKHNRFDKIVSQKLKKLSQKPVLWQRSKNKTSLINFKWHLLQIRIQKLHCTTAEAVLANRACFDNQRKAKQAPAVAWSCYYRLISLLTVRYANISHRGEAELDIFRYTTSRRRVVYLCISLLYKQWDKIIIQRLKPAAATCTT